MAGRAPRATGGGARSGWTWRRALALALCLLVLALTVRPHPVEASTGLLGPTVSASSVLPGTPDDPDGGPSLHCAHCGCAFVGIECPDAPHLTPARTVPPSSTGARAVEDAAVSLEAPPPRT